MKHNSDFKYDLKLGVNAENKLGRILENATIEVKLDKRYKDTGNVYVEYESRGENSGITTSQADYYAFDLNNDIYIIIKTEKLKEICRHLYKTRHKLVKKGGDSNTSVGVCVPINDIFKNIETQYKLDL